MSSTSANEYTPAPFDPRASSLQGEVPEDVMAELLSMRSSIDNIDATLVFLLAERFKATQRVGVLKAQHQLPPGDPDREAAQIGRLRVLAEEAHLDPAFAEKFLNFIISEVIRHHQAIADDHQRDDGAGAGSSDAVRGRDDVGRSDVGRSDVGAQAAPEGHGD